MDTASGRVDPSGGLLLFHQYNAHVNALMGYAELANAGVYDRFAKQLVKVRTLSAKRASIFQAALGEDVAESTRIAMGIKAPPPPQLGPLAIAAKFPEASISPMDDVPQTGPSRSNAAAGPGPATTEKRKQTASSRVPNSVLKTPSKKAAPAVVHAEESDDNPEDEEDAEGEPEDDGSALTSLDSAQGKK